MVCHCNLSNNVAKFELFMCYIRWLKSTNFFCTNDFICRAIWLHLSFFPYQCSIFHNVGGWQPCLLQPLVGHNFISSASSFPPPQKWGEPLSIPWDLINSVNYTSSQILPASKLSSYIMVRPEVSRKRMFSWGVSSYIAIMLSTRQQPPSL